MSDTPEPAAIAVDAIVDRYIKLRDRKAEMKREYEKKVEAIDEAMNRCEGYLLKQLNSLGVESMKTAFGTAYVVEKSSATVSDKEAFLAFVRTREEWSMLDVRANKTSVDEFRKEHSDNPPGVKWSSVREVNVRRN